MTSNKSDPSSPVAPDRGRAAAQVIYAFLFEAISLINWTLATYLAAETSVSAV